MELHSTSDVFIPPRGDSFMKFSFDFPEPGVVFGAHRFVLSWTNEAGAKQGEALLDFDVVQVTQVAQAPMPGDKPSVAH